MISRREFIKLFGISAAGVISGITTSKILNGSSEHHQYICGFIPDDKMILSYLRNYVSNKTGYSSNLILTKIDYTGIRANIISGNENWNIQSLSEIDYHLLSLREKILDKDANLYFEADLSEKSFTDLIFPKEKKIVIRNNKGILEVIELNKNYNDISIHGEQGVTEIKIKNNFVSVVKSSCKHKLCMNQHYSNNIICVPNKVTVKREYV